MHVLYSTLKKDMNAMDAMDVFTNPKSPSKSKRFIKVRRLLKGSILSVLKAIGIEKILSMRLKNNQARELLSKMCSPMWTFDSKHVQVYLEAIKRAIKCGNAEFVEEVLRSNPALIWGNKENKERGSIFHIAVAFRQEKIWNLIYGLNTEHRNKIIGTLVETNNLLHIAACPMVMSETIGAPDEASKQPMQREQQFWKAFSEAPGTAMKVQRELQWYKEVERMVPSSYRILANNKGETPPALFSKWHSELVKDGEKWMRDTATSCTIVATLIVTVVFAAALTLPGGNADDDPEQPEHPRSLHSGDPKFLWRTSFMAFVISDALSLFSSVTSVLMFLSILTSRFEEKDFLEALPKRLIIGLATLFLSIAAMMVTFVATLVMVLRRRIEWAAAPVALLASVPVTLFALLQFPLFLDMVSSTYGRGIFNRKTKCSFFNNPNNYFPQKKK
ncbi:ankyrin repeat-containing protein NPR4-like [Cornus florida]|uniref:ankyrin repeat-containing protein NPR4-like n=1 Tax=Cornus florida TaxID=4283 RepID=UPI0028A23735|nr:ankyrin repeat-containing protein NPR4-like [Cornus florida]